MIPANGPHLQENGHVQVWHLVRASYESAPLQMAADHALAESVWQNERPPTLRLYRWRAPAVTIGRHQLSARPAEAPAHLPVPAVRRPTGGRAVYHDDEVTFSLAVTAGHSLLSGGVRAAYRRVADGVCTALDALGIPAGRSPAAPTRRDGFACFAVPTPEEATAHGHKVAAIAQRRTREGLLVQGSLPLSPPGIRGPGAEAAAGLRHMRPELSAEAVEAALIHAFASAFSLCFQEAELTACERFRTVRLAATTYAPLPVLSHPADTGRNEEKTA